MDAKHKRFLLYGATGYTGVLTARLAKQQGMTPILSGRDQDKLARLAAELGFEHRTVSLNQPARLDDALADVDVVAHMAGPFSQTCAPMLAACLRTGTHYIDITGEYPVMEYCAKAGPVAAEKGIMLLPGAGFDVVPSDCLAAYVGAKLPAAVHLTLGFSGMTRVSRGTAKTALSFVGLAAAARRGGRIVRHREPFRHQLDFGAGPVDVVAVNWGDISTAYHSTGIPDIDVFFEATPQLEKLSSVNPAVGWVLRRRLIQRFLQSRIDRRPAGPDEAERARGSAVIMAEAVDGKRRCFAARLKTPEPYSLTAETALEIVRRIQRGDFKPGFQTPSLAYGADFILEFAGIEREDVPCIQGGHTVS